MVNIMSLLSVVTIMMNPQLIVRWLALSLWVTVLVFPASGFVPSELRMYSPIPTFRTLYGAGKDNTVRPAMTSTRNSAALLPNWLIERLEALGFNTPTLVQHMSLGPILSGKDILLHAQTGSGKTLAYLLPVLASIDSTRAAVQAMVIVPTKELVAAVFKRLAGSRNVRVMSVLEGSRNTRHQARLSAEPPHIVIGNADIVCKLVQDGAIQCHTIATIVVDEVDACLAGSSQRRTLHELLSMHLSPMYTKRVDKSEENDLISSSTLPLRERGEKRKIRRRQTVFASATIPQRRHFLKQCVKKQWTLTESECIQVHPDESMPPSLNHYSVICSKTQKIASLRSILSQEIGDVERAIIFCKATREMGSITSTLDKDLKLQGAPGCGGALELRKEMSSVLRAKVLQKFKSGECRLLVTSHLAARGLDIPEVTHVINFDLPDSTEDYIHGGGRARRLGNQGHVITIITTDENFALKRITNAAGIILKSSII